MRRHKGWNELNNAQRNFLKKAAHSLKPVVMIGQNGLNEQVLKAAEEAIESHELIKVKFQDYKEAKREIADELCNSLNAESVSIIGNILTIYRPARDPGKRSIRLPD